MCDRAGSCPVLGKMNWSQESSGNSCFSPSSSTGSSSGGDSQGLSAAICSSLPLLPVTKLTDWRNISQGAYGTVCEARHADWKISVAVKYIQMNRPMETERSSILKEAEILHRARFSYILPILGICNEPTFLGIVTEYMVNGSLDQLLFCKDDYPDVPWSLRFRILYEIALGVNFLHNMSPPLLHHDLKGQNILMDSEFHVKIADFGLSQWRKLSSSQSTIDASSSGGGTVIYMPPEEYEPSKKTRASVKHDIYSYAIIMWEVFSRKQPFEDATNPVQIMFTVAKGERPDTSEEALPLDIPYRELIIPLMTSGWAQNPDERPSFLKCLIDLEPITLAFDELSILEAILKIKRFKVMRNNLNSSGSSMCTESNTEPHCNIIWKPESKTRNNLNSSGSSVCQESNTEPPTHLSSSSVQNLVPTFSRDPSKEENSVSPVLTPFPSALNPLTSDDNGSALSCLLRSPSEFSLESIQQGVAHQWLQSEREKIIVSMTEACLNQCLDALLSKDLLMKEDYELITAKPTRTSKVRQLIDTCRGEDFAKTIVHKLKENRQMSLQPFPDISLEHQSAALHF